MTPETAPAPRRTLWRELRAQQGSFAVGSGITVVLNGSAVALYGISSILVARVIGPEQTGFLAWFLTGTTSFAMFADVLGIYYSSAYRMARESAQLDEGVVRSSVLTYGALLGVLAGALLAFVPPVRAIAFPRFVDAAWPAVLFWTLLGQALFYQVRGLFWGRSSFLLLGLATLVKSGGYGVLAVVFVYGMQWRAASEIAIAQTITLWVGIVAALGLFLARGLKAPSAAYLRGCVRVGWRAAGINWLSFLHQRVDQYIVELLLGAKALGLYAVAVALGEVVTQVPAMIGMVIFPLTAGAADQATAARNTLRRTLWVVAAVAIFMVPLGVFAGPLVHLLYGDAFLGSVTLLRVFLPAVVFLSALLVLNQHAAGMGYPAFQLWVMLGTVVLNVALNLALLPRLGPTGASLASSLSYAVWFALMWGFVARESRARGAA
jgi:O-antigen/teichoic acid export membrane protein